MRIAGNEENVAGQDKNKEGRRKTMVNVEIHFEGGILELVIEFVWIEGRVLARNAEQMHRFVFSK